MFDLVERSLDSRTNLIAPVGDLDAATNPAFRDALHSACAQDGDRLLLDLSDVEFMSAGAIGVIARTETAVTRPRGRLFVVCPNPRLRRLFEIAGLEGSLEFLSSHDALPA